MKCSAYCKHDPEKKDHEYKVTEGVIFEDTEAFVCYPCLEKMKKGEV